MVLFAGCRSKSSTTQTPPTIPAKKTTHEVVFSYTPDWQQGNPIFKAVKVTPEGHLKIDLKIANLNSPTLWVANGGDSTVSKIDTKTYALLGHYPLQNPNEELCYRAGRAVVGLDGSVWINCRGKAAYQSMENIDPALVPQSIDNKVVKLAPLGHGLWL
jgi:hypothetical protein